MKRRYGGKWDTHEPQLLLWPLRLSSVRMCWRTRGASVSAGAVNLDFQLRVEGSQITTEDRNHSFTPQDLFYPRESVAGSSENRRGYQTALRSKETI